MSRGDLLLGACKRIFLAALRMEKYGKILADLLEPALEHAIACLAYDDPITLAHGLTEKRVAHCAANFIDLHRRIIPQTSAC